MIDFREEQLREIYELIRRLRQEANARAVFLLESDGRQVAATGEVETFEPANLASLDTGKDEHGGGGGVLAVVWDERSPLGLVRLRPAKVLPRLRELWDTAGA